MFKPIVFLVLLITTSSFASDTTILISCDPKGYESHKMTPSEFVKTLNNDQIFGKGGARIVGEVKPSQGVDMIGSAEPYMSSKLTIVKISDKSIAEYIKKRNSNPDYKNIGDLHNMAEMFTGLQMETAGMCDFLIPTRIELLTDGFKPKADSDDKVKLVACEKKLEESCEPKKSVVDTTARAAKAVESFLDKKDPAATPVVPK
jgi:hypothetical protein